MMGVTICRSHKCEDVVKAPLMPGRKTTRKMLCRKTGFMCGHVKVCPKGYPGRDSIKLLCERCEVISQIDAKHGDRVKCPSCGKKGTVLMLEAGQDVKNDAVLMVGGK